MRIEIVIFNWDGSFEVEKDDKITYKYVSDDRDGMFFEINVIDEVGDSDALKRDIKALFFDWKENSGKIIRGNFK